MKKLYRWFQRIPRSIRVVSNCVWILLLFQRIYVSIGSPAFTPEQLFRKEVRAHLVGPAKILGNISLEKYTFNKEKYQLYDPCDRLILATTEEGVILFKYDNDTKLFKIDESILFDYYNVLIYRKKQGDITVLSLPTLSQPFQKYDYVEIPVIVFDSFPQAVRAEMEIELNASNSDEEENQKTWVYRKTYALSAEREAEGYFLFTLSESGMDGSDLGVVGEAISLLTEISDDNRGYSHPEHMIPVTVRFYDPIDNMIAERHVEIRSPDGEAYAQKQGNT